MIRVGLVGFGMAGRVFHAPLISSVEGLELAAVVERNSDTAVARYPGITVYRSLEDLLADASLGLFVLATPNGTHFPLAKELLKAGKNVVVDKPMTLTSAEAAELIGVAKEHGVLLAPFQSRRWDSDFLTLQKLLLVEGERWGGRGKASRSGAAPRGPGSGSLRQTSGGRRRNRARERRPGSR